MACASYEGDEGHTTDGITDEGSHWYTNASEDDGWSTGRSVGRAVRGTTGSRRRSKLN